MKLTELFADEDAVSPVIGVILMVAITVILAAVIGTFVLGLGENVQDSAPQANFQFEYTTNAASDTVVNVTHTGGEDVDPDLVDAKAGSDPAIDWSSASAGDAGATSISTGTFTSYTYGTGGNFPNAGPGDDVRIIWTSASGGTSQTIGQSTIPN